MDVPEGTRVRITLRHGTLLDRNLVGVARSFQQDGETRWELVDVTEDRSHHGPAYEPGQVVQHLDAVGFLPEAVTDLEVLT